MLTKNVIAFQQGMVVVDSPIVDNRSMAMVTQAELMRFGYMLSEEGFKQLGYADAADIADFHKEVIDYLKEMTGGARDYQPIYKGFPTQVMEMSERELWWNQLIGYWSSGSFTANEWTGTKGTAFEHVKYKMIEAGTKESFESIFTKLAASGTSLVPNDLRVIEWFLLNETKVKFPAIVPFKENLCTILGYLSTTDRKFGSIELPKLTTTDVLRIAVYMSGGDISLPAVPNKKVRGGNRWNTMWSDNPAREAFKFRKFSRKERKFILNLLEKSNLDVREMKLKDQRWIRLGEILHPGEYKALYPRTFNAFQSLRNEKIVSWYGQVEAAFKMSFDVGLAKLSERPGEFLRKLDWLIRSNGSQRVQLVLNTLAKVGINSSNKVLFEVYSHFEDRRKPVQDRRIMIKGARKHTKLPNLPAISSEKVDMIQSSIFDIIKSKLAELPEMGDCWIDEELKKIPLPTNMRSLNDTLVPIIRGQRVPFGTGKKVIRPFIHWFDPSGNLDIDLHGYLFDKQQVASFGFNGIHSNKIGCYSGDVRYRRGACAEYVDINVAEALAAGYKYFIMIAHNFNGGALSDIKDCVAGVMEREFPEANHNWKPDTIANAMKLTSSARTSLIAAYDLETREYIHLDLDFGTFETYVHSNNASGFFDALKPYIAPSKVSVYDLLSWHVNARGRNVSKETAATHFLYDDFASSYIKTIEYMGI